MTTKDVAEYLRVSQLHVKRLIHKNILPHFTIFAGKRKKFLIIKHDLTKYVNSLSERG